MGTPQYRYKAEGGVVIDQVFDSEEEWAEGWEDSPAKCKVNSDEGGKLEMKAEIQKGAKKNGAKKK